VRQADVLYEGIIVDAEDCERSLFSVAACDRGILKMDELRRLLDSTRAQIAALDPPPEAESWHRDYLRFLSEASNSLNSAINAYYDLDLDTYLYQLDRFDALVEREDDLVQRFREIQE